MFMGIRKEDLEARNAFHTAQEILQQPDTLRKTYSILCENEDRIHSFLQSFYANENYSIILTGAGSSEFIGNAVVDGLKPFHPHVSSIATTSIVPSPQKMFSHPDTPTLLVSFARSGNSPESVACANLANKLLKKPYHLVITCNESGALYTQYKDAPNALTLLMPPETNDLGFAMTSSVTSMILAAFIALSKKEFSAFQNDVESLAHGMERFFTEYQDQMLALGEESFQRIVYLGSDNLRATAQESALKILELTDGGLPAIFDTPVAFRHGPKTFVQDGSATIVYFNTNPHTNLYDTDLLKELYNDPRNNTVIAVSTSANESWDQYSNHHIVMGGGECSDDTFLSILYLAFGQSLAFLQSYHRGITTDSPVKDKSANRVVQGVTIYEYQAK